MIKIFGAAGTAVFIIAGISLLGDAVYMMSMPVASASLPIGPISAGATAAPETGAVRQVAALSGPEAGKIAAKQCLTCHTFEQNGPNRTGPNLWGVVGAKVASHPGFAYSNILKSIDDVWTPKNLDPWLASPMTMHPGTKMAFAGIKDEQRRKDVIAYLETLK